MIIANPIYDVVFKRMMENERVAKFFIGTLLEETIESVEVKPQEFTYTDQLAGLAVFRLDFIATIKTGNNEVKKILIKIQKAQNYIDLIRFRSYLAEQDKKEDIVNGEKNSLPITTIYILRFKLREIKVPCIKIERNYRDLATKKIIEGKSDFIEKLTHDSFVVQVDRITNAYQTKLDQLLSLFEQSNFVDDKKIVKEFRHQVDDEDLKITIDILHHAGVEPQERHRIETEQEAWRTVNAMFEDKERKYRKILAEKDKRAKALDEKDKALDEKAKALDEIAKALDEKDKLIEELKKKLNLT